jgi:hypothetical protein
MNLDTYAERIEVVGSSTLAVNGQAVNVTLDGKPAVIVGARRDFAEVAQVAPGKLSAEWSWAAVGRILARDIDPGAFRL